MNAEWWQSESADATGMVMRLRVLGRTSTKAAKRRLRLFATECYRLLWNAVPHERLKRAVEVAERFADGHVGKADLLQAYDDVCRLRSAIGVPLAAYLLGDGGLAELALAACKPDSADAARSSTIYSTRTLVPEILQLHDSQCDLLRCIFGNPYLKRPGFNNKWRTETVTALATGIYEERAFDRLPILADALEEAGCDDPAMLSHLRGPGPHCRGCWVLDLALGK